jgi:hypothetical protein
MEEFLEVGPVNLCGIEFVIKSKEVSDPEFG